jgi:hypothetical protein
MQNNLGDGLAATRNFGMNDASYSISNNHVNM